MDTETIILQNAINTDAVIQKLISKAVKASKNAYCKYSNFKVGASLISTNGKIYSGCNMENASYGLTICAERSAICQMTADGEYGIDVIVIYTPTQKATAPCGACRQVINEFSTKDTAVLSVCDSDDFIYLGITDLLPHSFGPRDLGK